MSLMVEYIGYNGTIVIENNLLILTHRGVPAKAAGLTTDQPRRIPLAAISGVRWKPASMLVNGWLSLGLGGDSAPESAGADCPDAVTFRRKDSATFEQVHDWLQNVVDRNRASGIDPSAVSFDRAAETRLERLEHKQHEGDARSVERRAREAGMPALPVTKAYGGTPPPKHPSLAEIVAAATLEPPRYPLEEQIEVAGETYHIKGIKRVFSEAGAIITARGCTLEELQCVFVPEPWNQYDPNAVAIMVGLHHVGYVPADLAEDYSGPLRELASTGTLVTGEARIWAKVEGSMVRARVTVLAPDIDTFP